MVPYPVIYFSDLSIKNINQIKTWYTAEIVYFTKIENIMRRDTYITVLDKNFRIEHNITITRHSEYNCETCDDKCVGVQYLTELIEKYGYIPDNNSVFMLETNINNHALVSKSN